MSKTKTAKAVVVMREKDWRLWSAGCRIGESEIRAMTACGYGILR